MGNHYPTRVFQLGFSQSENLDRIDSVRSIVYSESTDSIRAKASQKLISIYDKINKDSSICVFNDMLEFSILASPDKEKYAE